MFAHFGIVDFIDIILVALILFYLYKVVTKSGLKSLFLGIIIFLILGESVRSIFKMSILGTIFEKILNIGLVLIVIIFQEEIRRMLMSIGSRKGWRILAKIFVQAEKKEIDNSYVTAIVLACMNMAKSNEGALIVIQKDIYLGLYEQTGEILNADISTRLIENIFFKNSPLHDGAMIIVGKKVKAAGCILPISQNPNIPQHLGLRHRAGLGITQETDAKVLIVSEETGKISFAHEGRLKVNLTPEELQQLIIAD